MPPHKKTELFLYAIPIATAINFFSESMIDIEYDTPARKTQVRLLQSLASAFAIIYVYEYIEHREWKKKNLMLNKCGHTSRQSSSCHSDLFFLLGRS